MCFVHTSGFRGTWSLLNAHRSSSYLYNKTMLIARVTAAEVVHMAANLTFNNPQIARAINT
jgi:hypothetical protein